MKKVFFFLIAFLPVVAIIVLNLTIKVVSETISISVESISFSEKTLITNLGDEKKLVPNIFPSNASNKELVWESSDENIAVVNMFGEVTFVNYGSAYVTATTLDGNKKASIYFIITDTMVRNVVIYTMENIRTVKVGESLQIYSQVFPIEAKNKVVYYSSSNQEVATINEAGKLQAKNAGTTTIMATSQDGGYIDILEIEVYEGITSLNLPTHILTETSSYLLDLNLKPTNAQITKVDLKSENPEIATVDKNGNVVFIKPGVANITAKYENLFASTQIEYTNGYASSLSVLESTKTIDFKEKVWQIDYQVLPQNLYSTEVVFSSSNHKVATVNSTGLVEFEGGGASIISLSVFKSDGTQIVKQITLFVSKEAEEILIQDIITAKNQVKLNFSILPLDATSTNFYFKTNSSIASVDSNGNVNFTQAGTAHITIFAGSENSQVFKTVNITYTDGYAVDFEIENSVIINAGTSQILEMAFLPFDATIKNVSYNIVFQNGNYENSDEVVTVSENGIITGKSGGTAQVEVILQVKGGGTVSKLVNIEVLQFASEINFLLNLEKLEDVYISGQQSINFFAEVLPNSTSDKNLVFEIVENSLAANLVGTKIVFNYPATITLKATNIESGIFKDVQIRYTNTILQVNFKQFPTSIKVGETAQVEIESYLPSSLNAEISLRKNNEFSKISGQVVSINQNQIIGINGGQANLAVYVGGIYQTSFDISVIRLAQRLEVYPVNIQITAENINLNYSIFPLDTTTTEIVWTVENLQGAYIENNVLYFKDFSVAQITAVVNDESQISLSFTIERIELLPEEFTPTQQSVEMFVGEMLQLNKTENTKTEYEIISDNNEQLIVITSEGLIKAQKAGCATLKYQIYSMYDVLIESYDIYFRILEKVKQITLSKDDFDFYNGEYITAVSENNLNYDLVPSINVKTDVIFELLPTTIATLENNKLIFFGEGTIRLKAVSIDENSTNIWTIRYTGGYARNYKLNVDETISISKGQTLQVQVEEWIPFNTTNKNLSLQTFSSDALNYVEINQDKITAKQGGTIQLLLRVSDILTKTLTVHIKEDIQNINFLNKQVLISETSYVLAPIISPSTATNKNLIFEIDKPFIAEISNNKVIFNLPGTVKITARSMENLQIFDTVEITSTAGYPQSITLNENQITLFTGESFNVVVSSFLPTSASNFSLNYTVINEIRFAENQVVTVNQMGQINAVSVGVAVVRVSVINPYSMQIFEDITINVLPLTNNLEINFVENIEKYNSIFITSQQQVLFEILAFPSNVITQDYEILNLQPELALVEKGKITFYKTGILNLVLTSLLNENAKLTFSINYVAESYIYVEIDESEFVMINGKKQMSLPANTLFEFEILKALPSSVNPSNIVITEISSINNAPNLKVAEILNGKINFLNGGKFEVNLTINNFNLGNFSFEVIKNATDLTVAHTEVFVSVPYYEIFASVLPDDTTDKTIIFTSLNENLATVNAVGQVEFVSTGTVTILLFNPASNLSKTISIKYTKQIESIMLEDTEITLSVNSTKLLNPQVFPAGLTEYNLMFNSNNIAVATVSAEGRILTFAQEGQAIITVYVEGNQNIYVSLKVKVINYITNIALELDSINDEKGIANKQVFGTEFYDDLNQLTNTYQMEILSIVPQNSQDELIWTSSNTAVATVNETGLVTFLQAGTVTIRVQPENQYNPTRPVYDSYTFTLVEAVNIYNFEQFILSMKANKAVTLQNNAVITDELISEYNLQTIEITNNIYGNGYVLSGHNFNQTENKFVIRKDNVVIDNVVLRGENMENNMTLNDLASGNVLLMVIGASNVIIKNSIFENSYTLLRPFDSQVYIAGTIFQNAGFAHINLSHTADSPKQTIVTVKNTVYKDALVAAIVFDFDDSKNNLYTSKLIVEGTFLIYNFRQPSELISSALLNKMPEIVRNVLSANTNTVLGFINYIKHVYNGKDYYHMGILAIDLSYTLDSRKSPGIVDMTQNTSNFYRLFEASNTIQVVSGTVRLYTIMPGNNSITPDSTFDSSIYDIIRED